MPLYLFSISQTEARGYDTYSDAVVAAPDEETARRIHPRSGEVFDSNADPRDQGAWRDWGYSYGGCWARHPDSVKAKRIGTADPSVKQGVICASFHAG